MTDVSKVNQAPGGVALAEPPSSVATVRMPALQDLAVNVQRLSNRYLPQIAVDRAPADAEPLIEIGTALGLTVVGRMGVHNGPIAGIVANADGSRLVVANYGDNSVSVIDTASGAVAHTVADIGEPFAIAMGGADRAYVSTVLAAYDAIAVVDIATGTLVATHPLALSVRDLAVSPEGKVYALRTGAECTDIAVLDDATGGIDVIDLADLGAAEGAAAECLALSPDGQRLYVATLRPSGSELLVIDPGTHRIIDTVAIGSAIRDVVVSPNGDTVYVAGDDPDLGGLVDIIDTETNVVTGTVRVGGLLTQLTLSNDGERAYVIADDGVTVVCTLTYDVASAITLDAQPSCVAESPDGRDFYVADCAGAITMVSIASTTASLVTASV